MGKTAFLFSGQGAQIPGMMKDLYDRIPESRHVFETADRILQRKISGLCFDGSQEELDLTHNTQPCVFAADLAAFYAVKGKKITADCMAGFSLGEYAALVAAGMMKLEDAFTLIQIRADCMQEAVPVGKGAMAALGTTAEDAFYLCSLAEGYVQPANLNCPGQVVVSGERKAVETVVMAAKEKRIKALMLPVSAPFHCRLMESAAKKLDVLFQRMTFTKPECPVYMNVDALPVEEINDVREKLFRQVMEPVLWEKILQNMYTNGVNTFIELGPGKTLSGFVRKTFKGVDKIRIFHVSDMESLEKTIQAMK